MSEISRLELEKLGEKIENGFVGLRSDISELGGKMNTHFLEDSGHQGRVSMEIGVIKEKLGSLTDSVNDRSKFFRGLVAALVISAIAATVGFVIRNAIDVEVAKPSHTK